MDIHYDDVLEQVLHDLKICKSRDDVHDVDEIWDLKLSERIIARLESKGYAILEKYPDE